MVLGCVQTLVVHGGMPMEVGHQLVTQYQKQRKGQAESFEQSHLTKLRHYVVQPPLRMD